MGFQRAVAWDMLKVYSSFVEAQERRRYVQFISCKIISCLVIFCNNMLTFSFFFFFFCGGAFQVNHVVLIQYGIQ